MPDPPSAQPADWPENYKFTLAKDGKVRLAEPVTHAGWSLSDLKDQRFHRRNRVLLLAVNPEMTRFELYVMDYHNWHAAKTLGGMLDTLEKCPTTR